MSDQGITRLPCRDNIKRRIRKLRHNNEFTIAPNDPIFLSIPTTLCKTQLQDEFLRCDTGPGMSFNISVVTSYIFFVYQFR